MELHNVIRFSSLQMRLALRTTTVISHVPQRTRFTFTKEVKKEKLVKEKSNKQEHTVAQDLKQAAKLVDIPAMEAAISEYVKSGQQLKDNVLYAVLKAYAIAGDTSMIYHYYKMYATRDAMQNFKLTVRCYNLFIDVFGRARDPATAEEAFLIAKDNIEILHNTITYNNLLHAFKIVGGHSSKEEYYFNMMVDESKANPRVHPDPTTFNILISSYTKNGDFEKVDQVIEYMKETHASVNEHTYFHLITAAGAAEQYEKIEDYFESLKALQFTPSLKTFNAAICFYGVAGQVDKIESTWKKMEEFGVAPNVTCLIALVHAFGRAGRADKLHSVTEIMKSEQIHPNEAFYAALLYEYGMAGKWEEMEKLGEELRRLYPVGISIETTRKLIQVYAKHSRLENVNHLLNELTSQRSMTHEKWEEFYNLIIHSGDMSNPRLIRLLETHINHVTVLPEPHRSRILASIHGSHVGETLQHEEFFVGLHLESDSE